MKKIFLIAAFAGIVFASCQKEAPVAAVQNEGQQEISFNAFQGALTRGVIGTTTFPTTRNIQVAGAMRTADGNVVDFLDATEFTYNSTASTWKAAGAYYPIGDGDFRFLAYSEAPGVSSIARWYGSTEVELYVGEESAEQEIVYAGFIGNKTAAATAKFVRSQALVTVNVKTSAADQLIKINKIGFEDVKTSGSLVLKIDPKKTAVDGSTYADAMAQWIFNAGCTCHFAEMPNDSLNYVHNTTAPASGEIEFAEHVLDPSNPATPNKGLGSWFNNAGCWFDRLFPAQVLEAKTMVINYTLGGYTGDARLDLTTATVNPSGSFKWEAGKQYIYVITVNTKEITIDPECPTAWTIQATTTGTYDDPS